MSGCIDHGIVECPDCGHWQDAMDERDDAYGRQTAALRDELRIARFDASTAIGERDMAVAAARADVRRQISLWLWNQRITDAETAETLSDAFVREFGEAA